MARRCCLESRWSLKQLLRTLSHITSMPHPRGSSNGGASAGLFFKVSRYDVKTCRYQSTRVAVWFDKVILGTGEDHLTHDVITTWALNGMIGVQGCCCLSLSRIVASFWPESDKPREREGSDWVEAKRFAARSVFSWAVNEFFSVRECRQG